MHFAFPPYVFTSRVDPLHEMGKRQGRWRGDRTLVDRGAGRRPLRSSLPSRGGRFLAFRQRTSTALTQHIRCRVMRTRRKIMQCFITGATGFIGSRLAGRPLARDGAVLYFLVRAHKLAAVDMLRARWGVGPERARRRSGTALSKDGEAAARVGPAKCGPRSGARCAQRRIGPAIARRFGRANRSGREPVRGRILRRLPSPADSATAMLSPGAIPPIMCWISG